jgi:hypothetical protein
MREMTTGEIDPKEADLERATLPLSQWRGVSRRWGERTADSERMKSRSGAGIRSRVLLSENWSDQQATRELRGRLGPRANSTGEMGRELRTRERAMNPEEGTSPEMDQWTTSSKGRETLGEEGDSEALQGDLGMAKEKEGAEALTSSGRGAEAADLTHAGNPGEKMVPEGARTLKRERDRDRRVNGRRATLKTATPMSTLLSEEGLKRGPADQQLRERPLLSNEPWYSYNP